MELSIAEKQFIYRWFHSLLSQELSENQLNALQKGEFEPFFALMSELGYTPYVAKFKQDLTACTLFEQPCLELAASYAALFLLDGSQSALPYASAYLQGEALQQNLAAMDGYLKQFKLGINKAINEPSDHLCVYLEMLLKLLETQPLAEVQHAIQTTLLTWLPEFSHKVTQKAQGAESSVTFYANLLAWLTAYLQADSTIH